MQRFVKEAFPKMIGGGTDGLDLVIHQVYKASEVVEATKCMEGAGNIGKLICQFD